MEHGSSTGNPGAGGRKDLREKEDKARAEGNAGGGAKEWGAGVTRREHSGENPGSLRAADRKLPAASCIIVPGRGLWRSLRIPWFPGLLAFEGSVRSGALFPYPFACGGDGRGAGLAPAALLPP